jgi:two-component sensor histidine kinase
VRLDPAGVVTYASPNALSAYRRLGLATDLLGKHLGELTAQLAPTTGPVDEALPVVASGRDPREIEVEANSVTVHLRAIPLDPDGVRIGAIVLLRDVSELRRRERELLTKDATIREIHHRVKNNLQTVAALLRLQARRVSEPRAVAALEEAVRRVGSIAIVHETLSREPGDVVPFNEIVRPLARLVEETSSSDDHKIRFHVAGDAGELPGEVATPLAVVLNELMQNAVDHAFVAEGRTTGNISVQLARSDGQLVVDVVDDGVGLPPGFTVEQSGGLGLSIVHTLVTSELGGTIELRSDAGTRVHLTVPLRKAAASTL